MTGLRGFAALWVLIYHAWVASTPRHITIGIGSYSIDLTPFFSCGWAGVDIFYTLSAFLLTLPFAEAAIEEKKGPRLRPYFYHRVFRVFPAYYAQLSILLVLSWSRIYGEVPRIDNLLAHLFMAHNVSFDYFTSINGIWWTLPIEFSFYLLLPVLALLLRRRRWPILFLGAVSFTFLYRYLMFLWVAKESVPYKVWVLEQLPGRIDQFVLGMLAAYFFMKSRRVETLNQRQVKSFLPTVFVILGMIGVIFFIYLIHIYVLKYWDGHFLLFVWHGCIGFLIALLIYGIAKNSSLGNVLFGNRFILIAGVISYSVYLWHQLVITWAMNLSLFGHVKSYLFLPILIVAVPISLGIAVVSYLVIEKPFLMLRFGKK